MPPPVRRPVSPPPNNSGNQSARVRLDRPSPNNGGNQSGRVRLDRPESPPVQTGGGIPASAFERAGQGSGVNGTLWRQKYGGGGEMPPGDFDQSQPGSAEQFYEANQNAWTQPSATSNYNEQNSDFLYGPTESGSYFDSVQGTPMEQNPGNTQGYFDQFQNPVAQLPGLDAYYDRQRQTTGQSINDQFGSRGMYNSSEALGQISDAMVGLGAEQANREADYELQRLAEDRAWTALGGDLARSADDSALGWAGYGNDFRSTMGDLAGSADEAERGRYETGVRGSALEDEARLLGLNSGMSAATAAQGARRGRTQDFFSNVYAPAAATSDMMGDAFKDLFESDEQLFQDFLAWMTGTQAEALGRDDRTSEKIKADERHAMDMMKDFMSMYMGGM